MSYTVRCAGDSALSVEFENEISLEVNRKVQSLMNALESKRPHGMLELVPSYRAVLIHYDPLTADLNQIQSVIDECISGSGTLSTASSIVTEIPVLYDGEDIEEIAHIENKSIDEIIRIHSQSLYYVYMLGFAPGHPYCARFENPFSFKRRDTPRVKIDAGSIVVQLGLSDIIPFEQPCGWNIIGRTPVSMCDYRKENPFLLKAGQWIKYIPIERDEFEAIKNSDTYQCRSYEHGI